MPDRSPSLPVGRITFSGVDRMSMEENACCAHCGGTLDPMAPAQSDRLPEVLDRMAEAIAGPDPLSVTIEVADNGYAVRSEGHTQVVEEPDDLSLDDASGAAHAFIALCNRLADIFGVYGSRYDAQRAYCVTYPGDKHPDYDTAECPVCRRGGSPS